MKPQVPDHLPSGFASKTRVRAIIVHVVQYPRIYSGSHCCGVPCFRAVSPDLFRPPRRGAPCFRAVPLNHVPAQKLGVPGQARQEVSKLIKSVPGFIPPSPDLFRPPRRGAPCFRAVPLNHVPAQKLGVPGQARQEINK